MEAKTTGALLEVTARLVRGNARSAAITILILSGLGILFELLQPGRTNGGGIIGGAAMIYANYSIVSGLLGELDMMPEGYRTRPFWAMLGLSILSNLAILIGFVLLIVPGILLLVRWSLSVPLLIGEESGVFGALARSWKGTKGRFWSILGLFSIIYVPAVIGCFLFGVLAFLPMGELISVVGINLILYAAIVIGWHASVAIYAQRDTSVQDLVDVFV